MAAKDKEPPKRAIHAGALHYSTGFGSPGLRIALPLVWMGLSGGTGTRSTLGPRANNRARRGHVWADILDRKMDGMPAQHHAFAAQLATN